MNISCIVVDDEPLAIEKVVSFIGKIPRLRLAATFGNGIEALGYLRTNNIRLMFLDIQMDRLTGIEMLEQMKNRPQVILTTAYGEYALRGFELSVTDYLLKPFTFERFAMAVEKAIEYIDWQQAAQGAAKEPAAYIFVKAGYRLMKVFCEEILYIEGMRDFQRIVTRTDKVLASHSMQELESMLNGGFVRCHKSFIVSVANIHSIERDRIFVGSKTIPIGETYREEFFRQLSKK